MNLLLPPSSMSFGVIYLVALFRQTLCSQEDWRPIYYKRVLFVTYFNTGLRALDIRDPYHPKEIAYYIPAVTRHAMEHRDLPVRSLCTLGHERKQMGAPADVRDRPAAIQ